jgi:uncharacterized protein
MGESGSSVMIKYRQAEDYVLNILKHQLNPALTYHGVHHTLDVLNSAVLIADNEKVPQEDIDLLRIAVVLHDAGFIYVYKGHEEKGCEMSRELLPGYGFNEQQIERICGAIRATRVPQQPTTHLERIIADADLDYLGRDDFYPIASTLFEEMKHFFNMNDEKEWNRIQVTFLKQHRYHTDFGIQNRDPKKQQRIRELESNLLARG